MRGQGRLAAGHESASQCRLASDPESVSQSRLAESALQRRLFKSGFCSAVCDPKFSIAESASQSRLAELSRPLSEPLCNGSGNSSGAVQLHEAQNIIGLGLGLEQERAHAHESQGVSTPESFGASVYDRWAE